MCVCICYLYIYFLAEPLHQIKLSLGWLTHPTTFSQKNNKFGSPGYASTSVHMKLSVHQSVHLSIHSSIHLSIYLCLCIYNFTHTRTCTHASCMHAQCTHAHMHVHTCMHTCLYTCLHTHMHIMYTLICLVIYTNKNTSTIPFSCVRYIYEQTQSFFISLKKIYL